MRTCRKVIMILMMAAAVSACMVGCNEKNNATTGNNMKQTEAESMEDRNKESKESETMAERDNNQNDAQKNESRDEADNMGDRDGSDITDGLDDEDDVSDDPESLEEKRKNDKIGDDGMEDGNGILGEIGDDIEEGVNEIGDELMDKNK